MNSAVNDMSNTAVTGDRAGAEAGSGSDASIPETALYSFLDEAVARHARRPCIDFLGRRYSYAEIGDAVNRAAQGFRALGVGKGVKVGLCLPNTPYHIVCFFGILKAGGTVVNYNPLYVERELSEQVEDSETDIMVTLDLQLLYPKVAALLGTTRLKKVVVCPMVGILAPLKGLAFKLLKRRDLATIPSDSRHVSYDDLVDNDGAIEPPAVVPREDIAVLQYTGGTTGIPKGAILTHGNLSANMQQVRQWVPSLVDGEERLLAVLPFFHVFAMTLIMNLGVSIGAELVLVPRFELKQALKIIDKKRITILMGVPTLFGAINGAANLSAYDLLSMKYCISGGASLPPTVKERFEALTGCSLVEGYGLTECAPVATCNPLDGGSRDGSAGQALPGTVIEIRAQDGDRALMPTGERGEVNVVGPQVMPGYWQRPEETAQTIVDGRLRTGDIGYLDDDGFLFLVDRIKDLIICSGFNVYPRTVEEAIRLHNTVLEVTVIGVPDEYRGETPKAFVRLKDGHTLTEAELKSFLEDKLSPIEMPGSIEFRNELPKTVVGKLSKKELVAEEAARRGQS